MSKRDGKMYIAQTLSRKVETTDGQTIGTEDDIHAGVCFVYWTKTAARKTHGRNIGLQEISLIKDNKDQS